MLAERLPGVLPSLSDEQALEVTAVHSVVGALPGSAGLLRQPPYQAPHHTSTPAAIVGGGSGLPRPGAISLAHHGVLFLDEAPEYRPGVLNALREPLENGEIRLARASGSVCFPARFQLVLAANPCPCGERGGDCLCSPLVRRRYLGRLSGPLLDRVDLQLDLLPVRSAHLLVEGQAPEDSATVAARVRQARDSAAVRWSGGAGPLNATIPGRMLRSGRWRLPRTVSVLAERLVDSGALSARGYDRVLRIAWTVADLAGRSRPDAGDVAEAIELRTRTTP
jgi:magnesium chelatase family protein